MSPQQPQAPIPQQVQQPMSPQQPQAPIPQQVQQPMSPQQPQAPIPQPVQQPINPQQEHASMQPQVNPQVFHQSEPQPVSVDDSKEKKEKKPAANFRIGDHVKIADAVKIPPNELQFDEKEFLTLLAASVSLKKHEKLDIINRIPKLKQFQINELMRIFKSESDKFAELPKEHTPYLQKLVKEKQAEWESIEDQFMMEGAKDSEKDQADEIRKQLGL